jgi:CheY-like chemotaxis protein
VSDAEPVNHTDAPAGASAQETAPDGVAEARALAALLDLSFEAKLVHRRFVPLYFNAAFAALFGFADTGSPRAETVLGLIAPEARGDPLRAWGAALCAGATRGARVMRRLDGGALYARYVARPITWRGEPALAMAILEAPAPRPPRGAEAVRHVLVVSDDDPVQRRLRLLLGALTCRAESAADLAEAAALAGRRRYHLIIADLDLPREEGWNAARRLRALPAPFGAAPIIAIAPRAGASALAAVAAAGMDGLIGKPFAPSELERALALLAPPSIEAAELDQIEHEDR